MSFGQRARGHGRIGQRSSFNRGNARGRGGFQQGGSRGGRQSSEIKREFMTDSIYVGQLPSEIKDGDLKKLFPKARAITLIPSYGKKPGHAFLSFPDDASAAAAIKQGAIFKSTQLKVAYQTKRPEPQKRPLKSSDNTTSQPKKFKAAQPEENKIPNKETNSDSEDDDDDESMDFDKDDDESDEHDEQEQKIKQTVAKLVGGKKTATFKTSADKTTKQEDDSDDDDSDDDEDEDEEEDERPSKLQKSQANVFKKPLSTVTQITTKDKSRIPKSSVIDNAPQKQSKANQAASGKSTISISGKRPAEPSEKSTLQSKKLKNDCSVGVKSSTLVQNKNVLQGKGAKLNDDSDDDDEESDDDDDESDDDDDEVPQKPSVKQSMMGKQIQKEGKGGGNDKKKTEEKSANIFLKSSILKDDDDDEDEDDSDDDNDDSDDDDDDDDNEIPQKPSVKQSMMGKQIQKGDNDKKKTEEKSIKSLSTEKSANIFLKSSILKDDDDESDDSDDDDESDDSDDDDESDDDDDEVPQKPSVKQPMMGKQIQKEGKGGGDDKRKIEEKSANIFLKSSILKDDDDEDDDDENDDDDDDDSDDDDDDDESDDEQISQIFAAKASNIAKQNNGAQMQKQSILKSTLPKETKTSTKRPAVFMDDEDDDDESDDDSDDKTEMPIKSILKKKIPSTEPQATTNSSSDSDDDDSDDDDDDDDDDERETLPSPKTPCKPSSSTTATVANPKQKMTSTLTKSDAKLTQTSNKPINKTQLYINSIKESITVSDMKLLYPKAKSIKMQKRKVGPNRKIMQFAFVTFDNESDCNDALKAHVKIGGDKVNVSYAYAKVENQTTPTNKDANKSPEKKASTTPPENKSKQLATEPAQEQTVTDCIYVGQLPEGVEESDIKKLFPKSIKIELFSAKKKPNGSVRAGFAFVTFPSDNLAAAVIARSSSFNIQNKPLKIAYRTKRATTTVKA